MLIPSITATERCLGTTKHKEKVRKLPPPLSNYFSKYEIQGGTVV